MPTAGASSIDRRARAGGLAIAAGRLGIGVGALGFTRRALAALGFEAPNGAAVALARMAGIRDIALGLHALAARNDLAALREASAIGVAVDAVDAFAFGAALVRREGIDRAAIVSFPTAALAVVAGAWVRGRLQEASA